MTESARLNGRVALVTGAGNGLGRSHALMLAAAGACVLVNDRGGTVDGQGEGDAASDVVSEIAAAGGVAHSDTTDVGDWNAVGLMMERALDRFERLDIVVNNAGILRPRTLASMSVEEMESVVRVHLLGTAATAHFAAEHWRTRHKQRGIGGGRLINTTSGAGLFGYGQANYSAAKAGIAALTAVAAEEFARFGATANAVAPTAETRMSVGIAPIGFAPEAVSELVCWLSGEAADSVTGHVFQVAGGHISIIDRPSVGAAIEREEGWTQGLLDDALPDLVSRAAAHPDVFGYRPGAVRSPLLPPLTLPTSPIPSVKASR